MLPGRLSLLRYLLKGRHDQPSYSGILLKECVMSSRPNFEMVRILLRQGADPNMVLQDIQHSQDTASQYTPWVALLALTIGVLSRESWDPHNKLEWIKVAQSMVACGAHVNKRTIHSAVGLLRMWRFTVRLVVANPENHELHDDAELERILVIVLKRVVQHGDVSQFVGGGDWVAQYPVSFESLAGGRVRN